MCVFYRACCLSLGHKSDFAVPILTIFLTAVLTLWHQPLVKGTVLYLFFEKQTWKICSE